MRAAAPFSHWVEAGLDPKTHIEQAGGKYCRRQKSIPLARVTLPLVSSHDTDWPGTLVLGPATCSHAAHTAVCTGAPRCPALLQALVMAPWEGASTHGLPTDAF